MSKADTKIATITDFYKATVEAIKSEVGTANKWVAVTAAAAILYNSKQAYENDKVSYLINGIAPGFYTPAEIKLLQGKLNGTWDVPPTASARYKEARSKNDPIVQQWDASREAVRKMEQTVGTRWKRIMDKAWPEPREESEADASDAAQSTDAEHAKMVEAHARLIKKAQGANRARYNITEYVRLMELAQTVLTTPTKN